jgi:hypothetical protein
MSEIDGWDDIGLASGYRRENLLGEANQVRILKMAEAAGRPGKSRKIAALTTFDSVFRTLNKNGQSQSSAETEGYRICTRGCTILKL